MNVARAAHTTNPTHATGASDPARFLRLSMRGNTAFSTLSGLVFIAVPGRLAEFLGGFPPSLVWGVGIQLLVFAVALVWLASRPEVSVPLSMAVIVADLLWVVATVVVVQADVLTREGAILAIFLAGIVLLMAILQLIGVRRIGASNARARA